MTLDQVKERCEEHAKFLFSQMRKVDEPTGWSRTSFYRWLMERCPVSERCMDPKTKLLTAAAHPCSVSKEAQSQRSSCSTSFECIIRQCHPPEAQTSTYIARDRQIEKA
jgi:hypothetical protein